MWGSNQDVLSCAIAIIGGANGGRQVTTRFRRLLDYLRHPPHDYTPSTQQFLDLNVDKIKRELRLVEEGGRRGAREEPASDSRDFDGIEQEIVRRIETHRKAALKIFHDNMETYAKRLHALSIEGFASDIRTLLNNAKTNFTASVHQGRDDLHALRLRVTDSDRTYDHFRRENNLIRMAHYPESRKLYIGILVFILLVEAILNGSMLARGHELGILGGVFSAFIIALVNVLVFGVFFGSRGLRYLNHEKTGQKLFGVLMFLVFLIGAIAFNLLVAHYRDALGGATPEEADFLAVETWLESPFGIADAQSWILFIIGIAFSAIAAVDGLKMDDRYPDYGDVTRQRDQIHEDYKTETQALINELKEERDTCVEGATEAKQQIEKRIAERSSILEARKRHQNTFQSHLGHLEGAAINLLTTYREANKGMRKTPTPTHFSERWKLSQDDTAEFPVPPALDDTQISEIARHARAELDNAVAEVNTAFTMAFSQYHQIEDLSADEVRHAQAKQDAD